MTSKLTLKAKWKMEIMQFPAKPVRIQVCEDKT